MAKKNKKKIKPKPKLNKSKWWVIGGITAVIIAAVAGSTAAFLLPTSSGSTSGEKTQKEGNGGKEPDNTGEGGEQNQNSFAYEAEINTLSSSHLSQYPQAFNLELQIKNVPVIVPFQMGYSCRVVTNSCENPQLIQTNLDLYAHKQADSTFNVTINDQEITGKVEVYSKTTWNYWKIKITFENQSLAPSDLVLMQELKNIVWKNIPNTLYEVIPVSEDSAFFTTTLGAIKPSAIAAQRKEKLAGIKIEIELDGNTYLYGVLKGQALQGGGAFDNRRIGRELNPTNYTDQGPESIAASYQILPYITVVGSGDTAEVRITKFSWMKTNEHWDALDLDKDNVKFSIQTEELKP